MTVNGKEKVKSYTKKEYENFDLYEYVFENENKYKECYTKWVQTDFTDKIKLTPEEFMERHLDTLADKR